MRGEEIRERFLGFFERGGSEGRLPHRRLPSFPLMPREDPTLLFVNAGMAPMKAYFLGTDIPPAPRITTCQKCLRTSDIERVGRTPRHLTFFEMLGNFSFGDYFKREAILFAWELMTDRDRGFGLPPERLWVTIFEKDEETGKLWETLIGLSPSRILARGEEDNFWSMAETGPCGPCTELLYDFRETRDTPPDEEKGEALELWNLVFMQFRRQPDGTLERLPRQNVDTGAGLERLAWVLQRQDSVFGTDLLRPIVQYFVDLFLPRTRAPEQSLARARLCADHVRAVTFALAGNWDDDQREQYLRDPDAAKRALLAGVKPSNLGRGYVLRLLIRRALAAGVAEGCEEPFLYPAAEIVAEKFGAWYPELRVRYREEPSGPLQGLGSIIRQEEENFFRTYRRARERFEQMLKQCDGEVSPGEWAFQLHDTYGFPVEVTRELLAARGKRLDEAGFQRAMEQQRARSRARGPEEEWEERGTPAATEFLGYETLRAEGRVLFVRRSGKRVQFVLDRTPFYAEAGGQVGDTGFVRVVASEEGNEGTTVRVLDTQKQMGAILHIAEILQGKDLAPGDRVHAEVDAERRAGIRRAHTATHLLHRALREVFGEGATQAGSLVDNDYLRFDFHLSRAPTAEELEKVEQRVNQWILEDHPVRFYYRPYREALREGAIALFGEKYGETVRVLEVVGVSKELCGGTHLEHTAQAGVFKILREEGIGRGVRRIEAITGARAVEWMQRSARFLRTLSQHFHMPEEKLQERWRKHLEEVAALQKELQRWKRRHLEGLLRDWLESGHRVVVARLKGLSGKELSEAAALFVERAPERAIALFGERDGKVSLVVAYGEAFAAPLSAREAVQSVAALIGGGGGGRERFAQAGGNLPQGIPQAEQKIREILRAA